jgi:hypothetical protein
VQETLVDGISKADWPGNSYALLTRNCNHFSDELVIYTAVRLPVPTSSAVMLGLPLAVVIDVLSSQQPRLVPDQVRRLLDKAYAPGYINRLAGIGDRLRCILPEGLVAADRSGSAPVGPGEGVSIVCICQQAWTADVTINRAKLLSSYCYDSPFARGFTAQQRQ